MKRTGQGLTPVLVAAAVTAGRGAGGQAIVASGAEPPGAGSTRR